MTFIWLLVWLIQGVPHVNFPEWNSWAIGLTICAALDILGMIRKANK